MNIQTGLEMLDDAYDLALEEGRLADAQAIEATMKTIKLETDEEFIEIEVYNCLEDYGGSEDEEDDDDELDDDEEEDDDEDW